MATVPVSGHVLKWVRESAGLSHEEAAKAQSLNPSAGHTPLERLARLENEEEQPTATQLEAMAKAYRRPLLALYQTRDPRYASSHLWYKWGANDTRDRACGESRRLVLFVG